MPELLAVRRLHQDSPAMPRPVHQQTGFTLIELMFVVLLIGVMAAMIAPGLSQGRREADIANAATALVRLGSRARAHAQTTGLAHAIRLTTIGTGSTVQVFRGTSPRCNAVVWNWANATPIDQFLTTGQRYSGGSVPMQLIPANSVPNNIRICIQPNGSTWLRIGDGTPLFTPSIPAGVGAPVSDIVFNLFHGNSLTTRTGALRQVVFPSGNIPRWVQ
jgi:prepilin-type N-terminal cleavage/methylation domain-containing protein